MEVNLHVIKEYFYQYNLNYYIMKQTLLTVLCTLFALCGMAQSERVYQEPLVVTVNGESSEPQTATLSVTDNEDGTINFTLRNFMLGTGDDPIPVGNISVENIAVTKGEDGLQHFECERNITIQSGDLPDVYIWVGTMLGQIPVKLKGKLNDEKLFVTIDIDMQSTLKQVVYVQIGTDDFDAVVRTERTYEEPLVVTVNGESSEPQTATLSVTDNGDGTINFTLRNFMLGTGDDPIPVGNISVENIAVTKGEDGLQHFECERNITIQSGDLPDVYIWVGTMLGQIPVKLKGKLNDEKLFVTIDIDMQSTLKQVVYVQIGTDDFEVPGKLGDLNGDEKVDIADAVSVLNIMAVGSYSSAADVNSDQKVDIADFVTVLNIMAGQ